MTEATTRPAMGEKDIRQVVEQLTTELRRQNLNGLDVAIAIGSELFAEFFLNERRKVLALEECARWLKVLAAHR